ncbi:unnamed protein product [Penicillium salamii]|nr:unnamed protein product [Penicillium salamii]CAG8354838.1 unnamed protein product [Penicillium salamii]
MKIAGGCHLVPYVLLILSAPGIARLSHGVVPARPPDIDNVALLGAQRQRQDTIFNEAVHLLESMRTSPSCNRVAATRLVTSCQVFMNGNDDTQSDNPGSLDLLRSTYAARLALCEIDGAGAIVPPPCLPVTVSPPPQRNRFGFGNRKRGADTASDEIPKEVLEQCLRTLESRPQWWTSYSNSLQNALIICQATRMETEKEELIDLHQSIVKSNLKLNNGLQEALKDAASQFEQQTAFAQQVQTLQKQVVSELGVTDSLLKRTFGRFLQEVKGGITSFQEAISMALKETRAETRYLEKDIQNASTQAKALQEALQGAHQDAMARSQEVIRAQESSAVVSQDLVSSLHQSLDSLVASDIERIYSGMQRFDATMEWLTSRMSAILDQEAQMTEHLQRMEQFMQKSQSNAIELQKSQALQSEALSAHSQAQEAIQFHAQVSQALLTKASASAANLQAAIDDTTAAFERGSRLSVGGYSAWYFCVILLLVIAAQNMKVAIGIVILFLGWCSFNGFKHLILTHLLPHLILVHSLASIAMHFF